MGTFIPNFAASGKMQVEFSRNPKSFAINRYCKVIPVKQSTGYYLKVSTAAGARVTNTTLVQSVWADGQEAPNGDWFKIPSEWLLYRTQRYATPFNLGDKAVEQADWEVVASYSRLAAQHRMTERTQAVVSLYTNTTNWGSNYGTCTAIAGGKLDVANVTTAGQAYIKNLFQQVAKRVQLGTYGAVKYGDLNVVMNPETALQISQAPELLDYLKQSPFAMAQVRGDSKSNNGQWGLPDQLYGMEIVIEDAVKVTTNEGASESTSYILENGTIAFMSRPEGLLGSEGVANFATMNIFAYEDMTVETKRDVDNRRTAGRVVDDFGVEMAAPLAGYLVTACID